MKKRYSRVVAMLIAVVMVIGLLPSLRLTAKAADVNHVLQSNPVDGQKFAWQNDITLTAGEEYTLSFDVKGEGYYRVTLSNWGTGVSGSTIEGNVDSEEWEHKTSTFTADDRWVAMLIYRDIDGGSVISFDNVSVKNSNGVEIIPNGDFENGGNSWLSIDGNNFAVVEDDTVPGGATPEPSESSEPSKPEGPGTAVTFTDGVFVDDLSGNDKYAATGGDVTFNWGEMRGTGYVIYKIDPNETVKGFKIDYDTIGDAWNLQAKMAEKPQVFVASYDGENIVKGDEIETLQIFRSSEVVDSIHPKWQYISADPIPEGIEYLWIQMAPGSWFNGDNSSWAYDRFVLTNVEIHNADSDEVFYDYTIDIASEQKDNYDANIRIDGADPARFGRDGGIAAGNGMMTYSDENGIEHVLVQSVFGTSFPGENGWTQVWYSTDGGETYTQASLNVNAATAMTGNTDHVPATYTVDLPAGVTSIQVSPNTWSRILTVAYGNAIGDVDVVEPSEPTEPSKPTEPSEPSAPSEPTVPSIPGAPGTAVTFTDGVFVDTLDGNDKYAASNVSFNWGNMRGPGYVVYKLDQDIKGFYVDFDTLGDAWNYTPAEEGRPGVFAASFDGEKIVRGEEIETLQIFRSAEVEDSIKPKWRYISADPVPAGIEYLWIEMPGENWFQGEWSYDRYALTNVEIYSVDSDEVFYDYTIDIANAMKSNYDADISIGDSDASRFGRPGGIATGTGKMTYSDENGIAYVLVQSLFGSSVPSEDAWTKVWFSKDGTNYFAMPLSMTAATNMTGNKDHIPATFTVELPAGTKYVQVSPGQWSRVLTVAYVAGQGQGELPPEAEDPVTVPAGSVVHKGSHALWVDADSAVSHEVDFENADYVLSAYVRGSGTANINVSGNAVFADKDVALTGDWTLIEIPLTATAGAGKITVSGGEGASIYVDDIRLAKTGVDMNLIPDPGFECGELRTYWKKTAGQAIIFEAEFVPELEIRQDYTINFKENDVVADGVLNVSEWADAEVLHITGNTGKLENYYGDVYFKYDHNYLYMATVVNDPTPMQNEGTGDWLWVGDSIELFYKNSAGEEVQIVLSGSKENGLLNFFLISNTYTYPVFKDMDIAERVDSAGNPIGYTVEAIIPIELLGIDTPWNGTAFDLNLNIKDSSRDQISWTLVGEPGKKEVVNRRPVTFEAAAAPADELTVNVVDTDTLDTGNVTVFGILRDGGAQKVSIVVTNEAGDIVYINQVTSDAQGNYIDIFRIPAAGKYTVKVCGEEIAKPVSAEFELVITQSEILVYDVSEYRSGETYTAPSQEGKVFAGWYVDEAMTIPLDKDVTTGQAYAKFVDENVLSVKWQVSAGTTAQSTSTTLRILTSVDTLNYSQVGFNVKFAGADVDLVTNTVYEVIYGYADGNGQSYLPTIFSPESNYFMAHILAGIPQSAFNSDIEVTPKWITLDGTEVTGIAKTFKISDAF